MGHAPGRTRGTGYPPGSAESRRFRLEQGPGAVGRCRDLTRRALRDWYALPGPEGALAAGDALLLVSEVATNAYRHGGGPRELELVRGSGRLWVRVSDTSTARPRPRDRHRADQVSGHGLYLLQRLAAEWGWTRRGDGKAVWFAVDLPG
ncbi:ATP-binding protein [Streptomyces sp. C10-9-1]|uniref:ATP-binding protein n=1 Tax=Streptomyces sp. C10-9-1 TaxID=1859285 RepID=UPI00211134D0|nr:ATP-binding protein [Streptomyces sp. C10-9-1]MCQ6553434.1 ATP-binding protein [Streptomyces sp. C10-9-1]